MVSGCSPSVASQTMLMQATALTGEINTLFLSEASSSDVKTDSNNLSAKVLVFSTTAFSFALSFIGTTSAVGSSLSAPSSFSSSNIENWLNTNYYKNQLLSRRAWQALSPEQQRSKAYRYLPKVQKVGTRVAYRYRASGGGRRGSIGDSYDQPSGAAAGLSEAD